MLDNYNIPYTSPNSLSSRITFDKFITKKICEYNDINVVKFILYNQYLQEVLSPIVQGSALPLIPLDHFQYLISNKRAAQNTHHAREAALKLHEQVKLPDDIDKIQTLFQRFRLGCRKGTQTRKVKIY